MEKEMIRGAQTAIDQEADNGGNGSRIGPGEKKQRSSKDHRRDRTILTANSIHGKRTALENYDDNSLS